ncbi:hypothetical protein [Rossellomorea aquimaris]|uniref:hypothetical protein n=1 Tax=Rossellomorea aquimaris TaxID=189382 RepID=UPI001CFCDF87|nr:hypothetical protein [Rossellomorea aquimaris]
MNRWYFPFIGGIIFLFLIGNNDVTFILSLSGGITLGFFLCIGLIGGMTRGQGEI